MINSRSGGEEEEQAEKARPLIRISDAGMMSSGGGGLDDDADQLEMEPAPSSSALPKLVGREFYPAELLVKLLLLFYFANALVMLQEEYFDMNLRSSNKKGILNIIRDDLQTNGLRLSNIIVTVCIINILFSIMTFFTGKFLISF
jgi:hypothetical protein